MSKSEISLSKELVANSRLIAKGRRIRDINRLLSEYGGHASKWCKRSSQKLADNGDLYEYHWYEHHGIGRFEVKIKFIEKK